MKKFKVTVTAWKTFEVDAKDEESAKRTALTWFWDDTPIEDCAFTVEAKEIKILEKQTKSARIKKEVLAEKNNRFLVSRRYVAKKGCFNAFLTPTAVCVNLGEVQNKKTGKREFYCIRNFPIDCSKFGCPKMMPIAPSWLKDLVKIKNYRVEGIAGE